MYLRTYTRCEYVLPRTTVYVYNKPKGRTRAHAIGFDFRVSPSSRHLSLSLGQPKISQIHFARYLSYHSIEEGGLAVRLIETIKRYKSIVRNFVVDLVAVYGGKYVEYRELLACCLNPKNRPEYSTTQLATYLRKYAFNEQQPGYFHTLIPDSLSLPTRLKGQSATTPAVARSLINRVLKSTAYQTLPPLSATSLYW